MKNQGIEPLKELLKAIDQKNFDLDVWKIKSMLILKKLFGESDEKLKLIDALHYDYSSWSLRDKSGSKEANSIKEQAKGIVETAIIELSMDTSTNQIMDELREELTGKQLDQLQQLIQEPNVDEKKLADFISTIEPAAKDRVLTRLILRFDQ